MIMSSIWVPLKKEKSQGSPAAEQPQGSYLYASRGSLLVGPYILQPFPSLYALLSQSFTHKNRTHPALSSIPRQYNGAFTSVQTESLPWAQKTPSPHLHSSLESETNNTRQCNVEEGRGTLWPWL
jgi:hypothetical protein